MRNKNEITYLIIPQKNNSLFIYVFTVLHIAYIDTPFVNWEWVYQQGSEYFINDDNHALEKYLHICRYVP